MQFMISTQSKPHKTSNDDIAGYAGNIFWLMDGATQRYPPAHGLDAAWHVDRLSAELTRLASQNPDMGLAEMARTAIDIVGREFEQKTGLDAAAPQDLRPFSTLILCKRNPEKLEYLLLCDSTLAVMRNDKMRVVAVDARLDNLKALDECYGCLSKGREFDSDEFKQAMRRAYDIGQHKLNNALCDDAWFAVGQSPDVIAQALTGEIELSESDDVVLMSDGFTRAVDTLGVYKSWDDLAAALKEIGPEKIIEQIRKVEREDVQGFKHHRSSPHDDATILWARK